MRQLRVVYALIALMLVSAILVSACNSVEHRSETLPKKPLVEVEDRIHPKLIWSSNIGGGAGKSEAKLRIALNRQVLISADTSGLIRALNRQTGNSIWEVKTKTSITGGPTLIGDYVLVGTRDKDLYAYNVTNGQLVWKVPMSGEVLAEPQGHRDLVLVPALDGSVSALNIHDGQLVWRQSLSAPPIVLRQSSSPAVHGNQVFVGFSNGQLLALHRLDGSQNWSREIAIPKGKSDIQRMTDISADPVVKDGVLYVVSYQGKLAALKTDTGNSIWERPLSSYAGFTVTDSAVIVSEANGSVLAVNRRNGKTIWEQDNLQGRRLSKPITIGSAVVVGDDDGYLHWLSLNDGSFLSRSQLDKKGIDSPPRVVDNHLYVLGRGGKLAAYEIN